MTIPRESIEAAARAIEQSIANARLTPPGSSPYMLEALAALTAGLEAWPGKEEHGERVFGRVTHHAITLPLPLPQTTENDWYDLMVGKEQSNDTREREGVRDDVACRHLRVS